MSKLTNWAKKNPGLAGLLVLVLQTVLNGASHEERATLGQALADLRKDTDGDGVADEDDKAPTDPKVK